jgi:hypothetical protein
MVGIDAVRRSMQELYSLSQQHSFEVILSTHAHLPDWLRQIAHQLKFHTIEVEPVWKHYAQEHKIEDPYSAFRLSKFDPHLSPLGHQVVEMTLEKYLDQSGLVQRMMAKAQ